MPGLEISVNISVITIVTMGVVGWCDGAGSGALPIALRGPAIPSR